MYGLQRVLRQRIDEGLDWLTIRAHPSGPDALPWFWACHQRLYAAHWNRRGLPFVSGPNMVFLDAHRPRSDGAECAMLDAGHSVAMFCHSEWYRDLIVRHRGPANRCPIDLWPAPIDPWPPAPQKARWDVLIYAKSGYQPALLERLVAAFPRSTVVLYGAYAREDLHQKASRSRCCAYLSDNDHGPLVLQEILLAGCPAVGVRTGAPWVEPGVTGYFVDELPTCMDPEALQLTEYVERLRRAQELDRDSVREVAAERFDTIRIVETVLDALQRARAREREERP